MLLTCTLCDGIGLCDCQSRALNKHYQCVCNNIHRVVFRWVYLISIVNCRRVYTVSQISNMIILNVLTIYNGVCGGIRHIVHLLRSSRLSCRSLHRAAGAGSRVKVNMCVVDDRNCRRWAYSGQLDLQVHAHMEKCFVLIWLKYPVQWIVLKPQTFSSSWHVTIIGLTFSGWQDNYSWDKGATQKWPPGWYDHSNTMHASISQ